MGGTVTTDEIVERNPWNQKVYRMGRKKVLTGAVIVALLIAISGIGRFHSSPFSFSLKIVNPMAWGTSPSGTPVAVADRSGEVLLLLDEGKPPVSCVL